MSKFADASCVENLPPLRHQLPRQSPHNKQMYVRSNIGYMDLYTVAYHWTAYKTGTPEKETMTVGTKSRGVALVAAILFSATSSAQTAPTNNEVKDIPEEAFIYALPLVRLYSIMNEYAINKDSGQFKAPLNKIKNEPKVYTPADTAIVTPNSDMPYS